MSFTFRFFAFTYFATAICVVAENRIVHLSGTVTDPSGAPVAGATVILDARDTSANFSVTSNTRGTYDLMVPRGEYLLKAEAPGLALPNSPRQVTLDNPGGSQTLPLQLSIPQVASAVVVTATGTPQSLNETAKSVDIVEGAELPRRGIESSVDALRELAGVRISQRGGPGSLATIQIRGLRTFDTAVLVDGMRFRDVGATQGDAQSFIGDLLAVDVGHVEVLRGSGSSLYGTNAMGGVVNIVTDVGGGPFHGDLTADGGGLGEFRGVAHFGGSALDNRLHYSAGGGHLDVTRGVGDNNRYRNSTGSGLIDYSLRPGLVLRGRLLGTDTYLQLNDDPTANPVFVPAQGDPDYYLTNRFSSSLVTLDHQVSAPFSYHISYQALLSDRNVVNGPLGTGFQPQYRTSNQFNGRIDTLAGRLNLLAGSHNLLSAGYEFEREYFDAPSYDENPDPALRVNSRSQVSERSHSFDLQDQVRLFQDRLQISLSGRLQKFNLSQPRFSGTLPVYAGVSALSPPNAYTGDASVAYFFRSSRTKIRSHVGNGYRAPSLYERFGTSFFGGAFTAYGDPRLRPERSIGIDGGIDQYFASDRLRLSASYFYTRLQEVIAFDFSGLINSATDPYGRSQGYRNTGGGIARGVEFSLEAKQFRSTELRSSYTYTNARDRVSEFADGTLQVPRIFPHSFSLVLLQQFSRRWDAAFNFLAASDYLFPISSRTIVFTGPRQAGLSIGCTLPLTDVWRVRLYTSIKNLANQTYYEDGFRTPGRWAVAGMTFSF